MRKPRARKFEWRRGSWLTGRTAMLSGALVLVICGIVLAYAATGRPKPASGPVLALATGSPAVSGTSTVVTCTASRTCARKRAAPVVTNRSAVYLEFPAPASTSQVGSSVSITATASEGGVPRAEVSVTFTVTGANPQSGSVVTNKAGQATFTYRGEHAGIDHIVASFRDNAGNTVNSNEVTQAWANAAKSTGSSVGGASSAQGAVKAEKVLHAPLPAPVLGKTVNVEVVSGVVFIKLPAGAHASRAAQLHAAFARLSKGIGFVPLTEARQIPVGSTLDTTEGVVRLTSATAAASVQTGEFGAGIFTILQSRKQRGLVKLNIVNSFSPRQLCATTGKKADAASRRLSSRVVGLLRGSAHGKYATTGQYSAATVRGTVWSVANRCDGTLTQVRRGVVSVRDFLRRKTITLHAGQRYLAKAH
jgi:hypothetical protein